MNSIKKIIFKFLSIHNICVNFFLLKYKGVEYVSYPRINGQLFMRGKGNIKLGEGVVFNSSKNYNPIGGDTRMILKVNSNARLEIGSNTGISNSAIICYEKIIIGSNVKIGGSVKIYDTDFHSLDFEKRRNRAHDIPKNKPVIIGDDSFIGAHSIILKGVNIGNRCIIGASSVVTKSIPDDEIWAGNPAKFIRNRT